MVNIGISLQAQDNTNAYLSFEDVLSTGLAERNVPAVGIEITKNNEISMCSYLKNWKKVSMGHT